MFILEVIVAVIPIYGMREHMCIHLHVKQKCEHNRTSGGHSETGSELFLPELVFLTRPVSII